MSTRGGHSTDTRLGYLIALGVLVVAGGVAMLVAPGDALGAAGFALAIVAGLVLITVLHVVEG